MPTRTRAAMLPALAVLGVVATLSGTPYAYAEPDVEQAAAGTYRVVFDNTLESDRTWQINPGCASGASPCVTVIGNGRALLEAVLTDGRWSFGSSYADGDCADPPMTTNTWSWDPASLTGTIVDHTDAGCGLPERTETYSTFTMTRTA